MVKNILIILFSTILLSFSFYQRLDNYGEALKIIIESKEYNSLIKSSDKYNVSNELVIYSKIGRFFKDELSLFKPISEEQIILTMDEDNMIDNELSKLNKKNVPKFKFIFQKLKTVYFLQK